MAGDWSEQEVSIIVEDYFAMLFKELAGEDYIKAEHRRTLFKLLNNRSDGSIEFKHQNISAVLIELGLPYIPGYKPRENYQHLLKTVVQERLQHRPELGKKIQQSLNTEIEESHLNEVTMTEVEKPETTLQVQEPFLNSNYQGGGNYYKMELQNRQLGLLGEKFVISHEKRFLQELGKDSLINNVEHVSQTRGDSAGFDILSFDERGREKYIEVKTTNMGQEAPFYFTRNELSFSQNLSQEYQLYRLFNFKRSPKFFRLIGSLDKSCSSMPTEYIGWPG